MWCLLIVYINKFFIGFVKVFEGFIMKINFCSNVVCYCLSIFNIISEVFSFKVVLVYIKFLVNLVVCIIWFI